MLKAVCLFVSRMLGNINNEIIKQITGKQNAWKFTVKLCCYRQVIEEWRKLHNEELNNVYCSPNIVRVIKSRRMRWVGHVARMEERRGVYRVLVGKPEAKSPLGRPRRRWQDNIRRIFRKLDVGGWTGSSWFRIGTGGGML